MRVPGAQHTRGLGGQTARRTDRCVMTGWTDGWVGGWPDGGLMAGWMVGFAGGRRDGGGTVDRQTEDGSFNTLWAPQRRRSL